MALINVLLCIILIQFAIIVFQVVLYRAERKDLYNRIMCGSIQEYMNTTDKKPLSYISKHRKVINKWRGKGGGIE